MKYFIDTEFIEDGKTIDLISIGIIAEDGREYYACNRDCNLKKANGWVKENVLPHLPQKNVIPTEVSFGEIERSYLWKSKKQITKEVLEFFECDFIEKISIKKNWFNFWDNKLNYKYVASLKEGINKPEIWGYYASYDWVVFCQLFGKMIDLPKGFPMYINDLKQLAKFNNKNIYNFKKPNKEHDALVDARWNKQLYEYLTE